MEKQYSIFRAMVPANFEELMILHWMVDENKSRQEAIDPYYDDSFVRLVNRLAGREWNFKPDLGYSNEDTNGRLCFESVDDNFVIPVSILDKVNAST
jgi:rubredoxin